MAGKMKFYITTPIYYVNDVASVGHAYTTIAADVIARFHRLLGHDVFYLTGLDENSQKTVQAAKKLGVKDAKKYTDRMAKKWKHVWEVLNISNDGFIRTTEERHRRVVRDFFMKVYRKGDIYKGKYEGLYCEGCEAFVTESDLVDGKCPLHKKTPKKITEENYFFRLSKYQDKLLKHIEKNPDFIQPGVRRNEVVSFVKEGLKDVSISRPIKEWGIPLPIDKKHVIWVWFDALLNYISGAPGYWPADIHLMAKDIIRFHCVIWPCMLMSAGYKLPKSIFAHGFLTINGQKMSKSLGNVIDPLYLAEKFGVDQVRYYLMRGITFGEDGDFSTRDLADRVNNELVANLSNFCYRTLSFINRASEGRIGKAANGEWEKKLSKEIEKKIIDIKRCYMNYNFRDAVKQILEIGDIGNRYFQEKQPWVLIKKDPKSCKGVLAFSANIVKVITILLKPIVPDFAGKIEKQLNTKPLGWKDLSKRLENHRIGKAEIIFRKVDYVGEDPFASMDLRVAKVEKVEDHPEADKLYVLKIDLGTEKRTLVAGLKGHYSKKYIEGKRIVVVSNLKPAKLRGIESQGMLLAAEKGGKVGLLVSDDEPGADVIAEGIEKKPSKLIDIKDFLKLGLEAKNGKVYYKDKVLRTKRKELRVDKKIEGKVS